MPGQLQERRPGHPRLVPHGNLKLTLAGVIAQSSNIGTAKSARLFKQGQLRHYLTGFGLGQRTDIGVNGETSGLLPSNAQWNGMLQDRIAFGQSVSVNGVQMAAAVNTIANGGVHVSPSLIQGKATDNTGQVVGTDETTRHRVVSQDAAHQMTQMMERVVDPDAGTAPGAQVPGYVVAGKTGTAQRVGPICGCYNGQFTVSFAGFAPADNPRFTVYVVVQNPRNGRRWWLGAGPAFTKIMSFALRRYGVPPDRGPAVADPDDVVTRQPGARDEGPRGRVESDPASPDDPATPIASGRGEHRPAGPRRPPRPADRRGPPVHGIRRPDHRSGASRSTPAASRPVTCTPRCPGATGTARRTGRRPATRGPSPSSPTSSGAATLGEECRRCSSPRSGPVLGRSRPSCTPNRRRGCG